MTKTKLALALSALLVTSITPRVMALETDSVRTSDKNTLLDTLTIVGTRTETSVKNSPVSVSVVEREQIERRGADSVAELLRDIPGISIVDSAAAGMKRVRIRGEQSNRVVIFVDGQELTDHSSFGSPFLIDPASIERIEVVRGPASVLHGAKAIGGVINVITRKGADKPVEFEVGGSYHSGTNGSQGMAAISGTLSDFDYRLTVSGDDHGDRRVATGEHSATKKLENSGFQNKDVTLHLGQKLGQQKNHYVSLKANHHSLEAEGWEDNFSLVTLKNIGINPMIAGQQAEITINEAEIVKFNANLPKRDLNKVGLYYEGTGFSGTLTKIRTDVFYQQVDREFSNLINIDGRGGRVFIPSMGPNGMIIPLLTSDVAMDSISNDQTKTYGGSTQFDFQLLDAHYTILGLQFLQDNLETSKLNNITVLSANPLPPLPQYQPPFGVKSDSFDEASMQTLSAFIQDEWSFAENFKLIAGGRYYYVKSELDETSSTNHSAGENSNHSRFVKALGLTYTGLEHTTLRASFSEGYVMPTLLEQFTDSRAGRGIVLHGNPDLEPERSKNYELGLRYQNRGVVFDGTVFYSDAKNYITFENCTHSGKCTGGDRYINADKARSFGAELIMEYWIADTAYTPYLSTTWIRRELTVNEFATYATDLPSISGQLGVRYENMIGGTEVWGDLFVQGATDIDKKERDIELSGKQSRHLAGWGTVNFNIGTQLGTSSQHKLMLHANNLTNKHYRASVDEMPAMGRNVVLSFNSKF